MPGEMARSDPRPSVRITRGAGSGQHLASVLQEGRENANIDAGLGFIWRISIKILSQGRRRRLAAQSGRNGISLKQKGHVMSDMTLKADQERQGWTRPGLYRAEA
jgi:hypothetical protein